MIHLLDHDLMHDALTRAAEILGYELGRDLPEWLHPTLHFVLVWMPLTLVLIVVGMGVSLVHKRLHARRRPKPAEANAVGVEPSVVRYILRRSGRAQVGLITLGLATLPVLYATFELPKEIIKRHRLQSFSDRYRLA